MKMSDNFDISALVRPTIRKLKPYSSARDEFSGSASVFLDANENPFNAPLNRYPDPGQAVLKQKVSTIKGIPPGCIFLGNGSDEGIDILFRVLCEPGQDNVVIVDPTYGMYGVCAQINGVERRSVLLNRDFSLDADAVQDAVNEHTKLIFLCSPNNPTSNSFDPEAILKIVDGVRAMVVVDEAYIDFSQGPGLLSRLQEKSNLVILQTLSKAWGLAGIRLGMLFAHPVLIDYLSGVKYPYNINSLTIDAALKGLEDREKQSSWIKEIVEERYRLSRELNSLEIVKVVHPSDANFLLIRVDDPARVYRGLMNKGIIIRDRSSVPLCEGSLRITVGTREENGLLIDALKMIKP
jgi:histidinol-phosphate aminotransferase